MDVQTHDARLARLAHQRRTLPEAAALAEVTARRAQVVSRRGLERMAVDDLAAEVRKADADVTQVRVRRERDQQRMDTGAVGSPKELERLAHEIESLDRRISTLEDAELEVMEQLEQAQAAVAATEAELRAVDAELEKVTAAHDEVVADLNRQAALARSERDRTVGHVPPDLLALYEKVRDQHGGVGAAPLRHRRCEGCRLDLNAADLRELAAEPADAVLRCPECSRLLVRTSESGL